VEQSCETAGFSLENLSVVQVHDATAFAELQQTELLRLWPMGEGAPLATSGATATGGRISINLSGGPETRGHPIGATGLAHIYELVTQRRGEAGARNVEGASIGLAENGGGLHRYEEAVAVIMLYQR
jgi:acetyl-CoA acetyltransferase